MNVQRKHWIAVAVVAGLAVLLLGPQGPFGGFWGADGDDPTGGALVALSIYAVVEAAVFGLGVAFGLFGRPLLKRLEAGERLTRLTFVAIIWALLSWWPHGSFHQAIEDDNFGALAVVEWGFHATMLVAGLVIATFFWQVLGRSVADPTESSSGTAMTA